MGQGFCQLGQMLKHLPLKQTNHLLNLHLAMEQMAKCNMKGVARVTNSRELLLNSAVPLSSMEGYFLSF